MPRARIVTIQPVDGCTVEEKAELGVFVKALVTQHIEACEEFAQSCAIAFFRADDPWGFVANMRDAESKHLRQPLRGKLAAFVGERRA